MTKYNTCECENIQTQLSAYFDNQIPTWKWFLIRRHLKQCTQCSASIKTIEKTDKILNLVEPVKTSDTFLSNVMSHVNTIKTHQKTRWSPIDRLEACIENIQVWMRGNIQTYTLTYVFVLIFGVITMLGVTLYSPNIESLNPYAHYNSRASQNQRETLISFEVILEHEQKPKRFLKIR